MEHKSSTWIAAELHKVRRYLNSLEELPRELKNADRALKAVESAIRKGDREQNAGMKTAMSSNGKPFAYGIDIERILDVVDWKKVGQLIRGIAKLGMVAAGIEGAVSEDSIKEAIRDANTTLAEVLSCVDGHLYPVVLENGSEYIAYHGYIPGVLRTSDGGRELERRIGRKMLSALQPLMQQDADLDRYLVCFTSIYPADR